MKNQMCVDNTPVEHYPDLGLYVKREDLCCPGGPNFSKTRGVFAHVASRPEKVIGVLDTSHSQGGWAVARACQLLGKDCVVYYPETKKMRETGAGPHMSQMKANELGAGLMPLQAGRSAVLYHSAKKHLAKYFAGTYMMPNALKLPEMITETVAEVLRTPLPPVDTVIISASSGTIAAGVISGLCQSGYTGGIVVHQGYSRSAVAIRTYMSKMVTEYSNELMRTGKHPGIVNGKNVQLWTENYKLVDEGYNYADAAKPGVTPPFPSNQYYDLKAFRWWDKIGRAQHSKWKGVESFSGEALLWNVG